MSLVVPEHVVEDAVGNALKKQPLSPADYLAWEAAQPQRHEYVRGEVFLMTGGTDRHNTATLSLAIALRQHLRGSRCRVYVNDVKLRVESANAYFYPDLMVTCSVADEGQRLVKREPVLVVEVLSRSTAAFDRGDKFADYRLLPSLHEYLLVDAEQRRCELYRKGDDGLWVLHPGGPTDTLHLACVDLRVPPAELWAELEPPDDDAANAAGAADAPG